jgi:hypothetical protein
MEGAASCDHNPALLLPRDRGRAQVSLIARREALGLVRLAAGLAVDRAVDGVGAIVEKIGSSRRSVRLCGHVRGRATDD